jgi:hypothetical protein
LHVELAASLQVSLVQLLLLLLLEGCVVLQPLAAAAAAAAAAAVLQAAADHAGIEDMCRRQFWCEAWQGFTVV